MSDAKSLSQNFHFPGSGPSFVGDSLRRLTANFCWSGVWAENGRMPRRTSEASLLRKAAKYRPQRQNGAQTTTILILKPGHPPALSSSFSFLSVVRQYSRLVTP